MTEQEEHLRIDFSHIKAFALDIDGVATNGQVLCTPDGDLLRSYDSKDGFALRMAVMNGYPVGVITGGTSESIRHRMALSGVKPEDVFLHCRDKREEFAIFCRRYALDASEVMYFGDDIPDVGVLRLCGIGVAPADASPEAREAARWVTASPGGHGCLKEGIEAVLRAQGRWQFDGGLYKKMF